VGHPAAGPGTAVRLERVMHVNLGCGDRYVPGWWNIDHDGCPHRKDEVVDLSGPLPFRYSSVELAYMGHLLEHLTVGEGVLLLERLRPCMTVSGAVMVVGPDVDLAWRMAEAGTLDVTMDELRFGGHRWPGDEHQWECGPGTVRKMLELAGWEGVAEVPFGMVDDMWPVADRGPAWQFAVTARAGMML
jgi:hypothetical protein